VNIAGEARDPDFLRLPGEAVNTPKPTAPGWAANGGRAMRTGTGIFLTTAGAALRFATTARIRPAARRTIFEPSSVR
jgi:hypothetical protein